MHEDSWEPFRTIAPVPKGLCRRAVAKSGGDGAKAQGEPVGGKSTHGASAWVIERSYRLYDMHISAPYV